MVAVISWGLSVTLITIIRRRSRFILLIAWQVLIRPTVERVIAVAWS
jgi:hypothetical protein